MLFAGEFGSERLVQKVVDIILRYSASKEKQEDPKPGVSDPSSAGAGGAEGAEWRDDTASKIILTGNKVRHAFKLIFLFYKGTIFLTKRAVFLCGTRPFWVV